jgi:hypothetical protein
MGAVIAGDRPDLNARGILTITLTGGLEEMDPNSKDSKEINSTLEGLDKLSPK